jgi:hypothetical protein
MAVLERFCELGPEGRDLAMLLLQLGGRLGARLSDSALRALDRCISNVGGTLDEIAVKRGGEIATPRILNVSSEETDHRGRISKSDQSQLKERLFS